jgi:hypothetical protein
MSWSDMVFIHIQISWVANPHHLSPTVDTTGHTNQYWAHVSFESLRASLNNVSLAFFLAKIGFDSSDPYTDPLH